MPSTMTGQVNPVKKPLDRLQDSESLYRRDQNYGTGRVVDARRNENVAKNEDAHRGSHIKNETAAENRGYREPTRDLNDGLNMMVANGVLGRLLSHIEGELKFMEGCYLPEGA